ncbi:MAG: c-type cytochrome biogenesis protein CcmF, partial [Rubrivivax sp.]|nr:c-type cytochrome biogenesis protein CcmF [Rubrivivax sp.]
KISVGAPYFETVFAPLMAPVVFLMGVGPAARWRDAPLPELATRLRWAAGVAVVAGVAGSLWAAGGWRAATLPSTLSLVMAAWVVATVAADPRRQTGRDAAGRWRRPPRGWIGMSLAHLGVAAFIVGVTVVKTHETERDVRMAVGDKTTVGSLHFTLRGLREIEGPNFRATQGWVEVTEEVGGTQRKRADLLPEKRVYRVQRNPMTEAAVHARLQGDWYVSLGEPLPDGAWTVRVYVKPMVGWIWGGCLLMALGGAVAASDRRYRVTGHADALRAEPAAEPTAEPLPARVPA